MEVAEPVCDAVGEGEGVPVCDGVVLGVGVCDGVGGITMPVTVTERSRKKWKEEKI